MKGQNAQNNVPAQERNMRDRREVASNVLEFKQRDPDVSQRAFAREHGIPRTALQGWLEQEKRVDARPEWVAFFESPAGQDFLHQLYVAAMFVMNFLGPQGIRPVGMFIELVGLAPFIATSDGVLHKTSKAIEQGLCRFEDEHRPGLVEQMKQDLCAQGSEHRQIILSEDETFHPAICLVAIEACSNFIVLEEYSARRDAASWTRSVKAATSDLPVEVIAVCSDEARGLKAHIRRDLGAQHLCECFHVQHEISKGCSAALGRRERRAREDFDQARARLETLCPSENEQETAPPAQETAPPAQETLEIKQARKEVESAWEVLREFSAQREEMRQAIRGVSKAYHPYDLESGARRESTEVSADLQKCFERAQEVADEAELSQRAHQSIKKAARLKEAMAATVAFFHSMVTRRVAALAIGSGLKEILTTIVIPMCYLRAAASKASKAEEKKSLREAAQKLQAQLEGITRWCSLPEGAKSKWLAFAEECARLFVRSSSAVEGRNGQLSLHHHGLHRLSGSRLRALTIIHNYVLRRADGSTAAERFFGVEHANVFEWLLGQVPAPSRPAKKRSRRKAA